jgi:hypothetical protein
VLDPSLVSLFPFSPSYFNYPPPKDSNGKIILLFARDLTSLATSARSNIYVKP